MKNQQQHRLSYHIHKGVYGEWIGQLVQIPEVIVHADTKQGIKKMLYKAIDAYFDAFPEEHKKILTQLSEGQERLEEIEIKARPKRK